MKPEPDETGTGWNPILTLTLGPGNSIFAWFPGFWDENPAMSIFSMRGIRWFQRELLKRLIYISFERFWFWGVWGRFGPFLVSETYPPWTFRSWDGCDRNRRNRNWRNRIRNWNRWNRNWVMSKRDRTEPNRGHPAKELWTLEGPK